MTSNLPPAVVMGLSPTGLHAIRSLGRASIPVIGVGAASHAGAASRYLSELFVHPDAATRVAWVQARFKSAAKVVVIPTTDEDVSALLDHVDALGPQIALPGAYRDGVARALLDKAAFYELCAEQGQAFPPLIEGLAADLRHKAAELRYPCFVKPAEIHACKAAMGGKKGWIARDAEGLRRLLQSLPPNTGTLLVQRIVPGPESAITLYCGYFDDQSRPHHGFTAAKLRQWPPGFGSASRVQSTDDPETREAAERFLTGIGYRGIAAAEFKRDPESGQLIIIEVNARPSLWFEAAAASGHSPVRAAYHHLGETGQAVPAPDRRIGVQWLYGGKDAAAAGFYALARDFVLPAPDVTAAGPAHRRVRAVFASDDWRPILAETMALGRKALNRLPGGSHAG